MIKQINLSNNKVTAIIDNDDENPIKLTDLSNLDEKVIASILWSGKTKNVFMVPSEVLATYIYKGDYGRQKNTPTPFGETMLNVPAHTELAINVIATSDEVNWSNETKNATLTLTDGSCIAFDAIVIRANKDAWQVMLAGDALTKLSLPV